MENQKGLTVGSDEWIEPTNVLDEPINFDNDVHPRHTKTGTFVPRNDIDQAMRRITQGTQTRRDTIPKPTTPAHPTTG